MVSIKHSLLLTVLWMLKCFSKLALTYFIKFLSTKYIVHTIYENPHIENCEAVEDPSA